MKLGFAFAAAFLLAASASAFDFDPKKFESVLDGKSLASLKANELVASADGAFFKWTNARKNEVQFPAMPQKELKLALFGMNAQELIFKFSNGAFDSLYVSLYNRGDVGDIALDDFNKMVASVDSKLSALLAEKGVDLKKSKLNAETNIEAKAWVKDGLGFTLKWNYSGKIKSDYRPEYIQLNVERFNPKDDPRKRTSVGDLRAGMASFKDLPINVLKDDSSGDVHVENIPMIDQGNKGYCVGATVARILRYYGVQVTQHDISQVAGADAEKGTDLRAMLTSIRSLAVRYGVKIREYYRNDTEIVKDVKDVERFVKKYNGFARKNREKPVEMVVKGNTVYVTETFDAMDQELLGRMRVELDKNDQKNFLRDIRQSIDRGIPLVWSVKLGVVKEEEIPQIVGYHMRLITGYNNKTSEIIYSDSWGERHDVKHMTYDDAWIITQFLIGLDPLK